MFVKICGLKKKEDIIYAIYEGADAIGFIVGVTHKSEDALDPYEAVNLIKFIPKSVKSVLVTHFVEIYPIVFLVDVLKPSVLQLQGEIEGSDILRIRRQVPNVEIIKAIHVINNESINIAKQYEPYVDYILLDSRTQDRLGGTGLTHDWSISAQIVKEIKKPVILAGGLNPENVCKAIKQVKPFGVDVNSGTKGNDGFKDYRKVKDFIKIAKSCQH